MPDWRQRNFIDRAVEPATGPRDAFIKFMAGNRAFAARIAENAASSRIERLVARMENDAMLGTAS